MRVYELRQRPDMTELNNREDVNTVKEQAGIDCRRCRTLFARTEQGEYVEIWGTRSVNPNEQDEAHAHEVCPRCGNRNTERDNRDLWCEDCEQVTNTRIDSE